MGKYFVMNNSIIVSKLAMPYNYIYVCWFTSVDMLDSYFTCVLAHDVFKLKNDGSEALFLFYNWEGLNVSKLGSRLYG
jgi:hypothetical protein